MGPRKNEIVKESYFLHIHPLLFLYLYEIKKKLVTNNKKFLNCYIWYSAMSKLSN
jgi:hypothetical protein